MCGCVGEGDGGKEGGRAQTYGEGWNRKTQLVGLAVGLPTALWTSDLKKKVRRIIPKCTQISNSLCS